MKNINPASKIKVKIPKNQIILALKLWALAPLTQINQKMKINIMKKLTINITGTNKVNQNKKLI